MAGRRLVEDASDSESGDRILPPTGLHSAHTSAASSPSRFMPKVGSCSSRMGEGGSGLASPSHSNKEASGPMSILSDDDEDVWFHHEEMSSGAFPIFEEIRSQGKLCDVTLVTGSQRFSAHRIVLAGSIPYFRSMFTSEMAEAEQNEIIMQGIEAEVLEQLINFAYTSRIRITGSNVQALMVGSSFLQLDSILEASCHFLQQRLQGSNVLAIRQFASALGCHSLVRATDRFLQKHFVAVSRSEDFYSLQLEDLLTILVKDGLNVTSEEQVFEAAVNWVRRDTEERRKDMSKLLACIRLPLLKPQYLTDRVASEELIRGCLKCRDLLDEAKDYHLMPERRPLLQTFRTKPRCCNDIPGIIYAVGGLTNSGDSLSTVEMFDPMVGRWSSIEPMTTLRSRVGVAVMHGLLYAIGGFNGHERLKTVEVFTPETRRWREVAPLNNKRSALGAAVAGDRLYVCGGYDGITSLSTVEVYDDVANRWHLVNSMSKQRSASGIAVLDGKIYILGGHDGMSIFNSVECFDPDTGKWSSVKQMLNRRCRLGACTLNGKLYACGGYDGGQFLKSVEVYDPTLDEWKLMPNMNVKRSRVALVTNCGKLFAIGGYDGISNLSSMEVFSVEDQKWTLEANMIAHEGGVGIGVVPIVPSTDI